MNKGNEISWDYGKLYELICHLENEAELHSICIMAQGDILCQGSWKPFSLEKPQMMHSLSKIGTSICVGLAIGEGKLSLEDHFLNYVAEELPREYDPSLEKITIYDLLTMQAGSPFCANNVWFSGLEKDWETCWLGEKKIARDIGNTFHYDSGCSYTLSRIVSEVMGKTCLELLNERVFSEIGLEDVHWLQSPEGFNTGGWGMYLTAPQICRIGQLLIQNGNWKGKQLIPENWVREMTKPRISIPESQGKALDSYAYHIKAGKEIFAAEGAFGQFMICFRSLPVVIAITAGTMCEEIPDLCQKYIQAAAESNDQKQNEKKQLQEKMGSLEIEYPSGNNKAAGLQDMVLNRWITLEENPRNIEQIFIKQEEENVLAIWLKSGEKRLSCRAGFHRWITNELFPGDFTKETHCLSYAFDGDSLCVKVCLINTSYVEHYTFTCEEGKIHCAWKPNVTYLDGNDNRERFFKGRVETEDAGVEK